LVAPSAAGAISRYGGVVIAQDERKVILGIRQIRCKPCLAKSTWHPANNHSDVPFRFLGRDSSCGKALANGEKPNCGFSSPDFFIGSPVYALGNRPQEKPPRSGTNQLN
jgi:hypothetical protein